MLYSQRIEAMPREFWVLLTKHWGFSGGSDAKESACDIGDQSLTPGSGRCPGEGNGNPLQYSCLENPMDREACPCPLEGYSPWGHKDSGMTEQISTLTIHY